MSAWTVLLVRVLYLLLLPNLILFSHGFVLIPKHIVLCNGLIRSRMPLWRLMSADSSIDISRVIDDDDDDTTTNSDFSRIIKLIEDDDVTIQEVSVRNKFDQQQHDNQSNRKYLRPRLPVLRYEDGWVCINKPSGISVHTGSENQNQVSARKQQTVKSLLKRQLSRKVLPVHRLDHRTSGALIFAFTNEVASILNDALHHNNHDNNSSQKIYVALVRGDWDTMHGRNNNSVTVNRPIVVKGIEKNATTIFSKLGVTVVRESNFSYETIPAVSENFKPYRYYNDTIAEDNNVVSCTFVVAQPVTGRTHQIRRHAAVLGMPIIGDTEHGNSKVNRWWRTNFGLNRLALHCLVISFRTQVLQMPNECIDIVAPLTDDLKNLFLQNREFHPMWKDAVKFEPRLLVEHIDYYGGTKGIEKDWQLKRRSAIGNR